MYRQGPWGVGWITGRAENVDPEAFFTLVPASYDGRASGRTGNAAGCDWFGISSLAEHPNELFDVLYWLCGPEAGEFVITAGRTAPMPRIDALTSPLLADYPIMKVSSEGFLSAEPPFTPPVGQIGGGILLLAVAYWLYRIARGKISSS